ncbi:hypothetical protein, partial [Duganella sp. BJB1802]|uniref:hypothetical protein n=1 Tax=Duganella sp. BJB1802 TaxID=2744575 RepID=UPI001C3DC63A
GQFEQFRIGLGPFATLYNGHHFSLMVAVSCQMTVYTKLITPSLSQGKHPQDVPCILHKITMPIQH